MIGVTKKWQ